MDEEFGDFARMSGDRCDCDGCRERREREGDMALGAGEADDLVGLRKSICPAVLVRARFACLEDRWRKDVRLASRRVDAQACKRLS